MSEISAEVRDALRRVTDRQGRVYVSEVMRAVGPALCNHDRKRLAIVANVEKLAIVHARTREIAWEMIAAYEQQVAQLKHDAGEGSA